MEFRGRLKAPGDPGEGIAVELRLTDVFLELSSEATDLGRWRLDDVAIERVAGDHFDLTLDDETVVFVAGDALSFAYEGVGYADEIRAKLKKRRRRKKRGSSGSLIARLQAGPDGGSLPPEPSLPESATEEAPAPAPAAPTEPQPAPLPPAPVPPAPSIEDGIPVVVEAPAVTYVDTMSTVVAEVPDEPVIGSVLPPRPTPAPETPDAGTSPELPPPKPPAEAPEGETGPPAADAPEGASGEVTGNGSTNPGSMRRFLDRIGRKPDDHEHVYGDARRTGVITRRVCQVCGHVTFDSDRAYRGW